MSDDYHPSIPFILGAALGLGALSFYYVIAGYTSQLVVDGFRVHHLYIGIGLILGALPIWSKDHHFWSLFLLGLGSVLMVDGAARTLYGVAPSYP